MNRLTGKIQDSELEIMKILWRTGEPVALIDMRLELSEKCGWEDSTVKTLLRRLCDKGVARLESRGMYSAVVAKEEYESFSARDYVGKVFDGSAKNLVASLLSDGQLSEADIEELREMFNKEAGK